MALAQLLSDPSLRSDERYREMLAAFEEVALATTRKGFVLDEVMMLVGRLLCELLRVSRCSVYLRGEDAPFKGRAGWCRGRDIGDQIRTLVAGIKGDEFTAEIVRTAEPVLITDARHDPRTIKETMRRWRIRDMLGVPLVVEDDVIGIIYVDNEDEPHEYSIQEIHLAQVFAGLTATAVRQASLFSELEQRAKVIDRQRRMLQHLSDTDHRLTRAVLDGADVQALLDLLCDLVSKPIILYDPDVTPLAWAAPEGVGLKRAPSLSTKALSIPWVRQTIDRAVTDGTPVLLPPAPDLDSPTRRLLCPLRIDQRLAGFLDVVELGSRLRSLDGKIVERAAMTVALQLLTQRRQAEAEGLARQDFLADLLHGRRAAQQLRDRAPLFGLDPSRPHVVIRLAYRDSSREETGIQRRSRAEARLRELLDGEVSLLSTGVPGADLFLMGLDPELTGSDVEAVLTEGFDQLQDLAVDYALVSRTATDLGQLAALSGELRDIAGMLTALGAPPQVAFARKFGMLRFAASADGMGQALAFAEDLIVPIVQHDQSDGRILETLRVYLEHGGQVRTTSRELDVHENTVRYRLTGLREALGIDVSDPETMMELQFALQIHDTIGGDFRSVVG